MQPGTDLFNKYETDDGMLDGMCSHHVICSRYSKVLADMSKIPVDVLQQKDAEAGELFVNHGWKGFAGQQEQ